MCYSAIRPEIRVHSDAHKLYYYNDYYCTIVVIAIALMVSIIVVIAIHVRLL